MPGGRPPILTQPVRTEPDGTLVTAGQHLVSRVALGLDHTAACRETGIARQTLHNWRRRGAVARRRWTQGHALRDEDRPYVEFLDALEAAEAQWEARHLERIEAAAGQPQETCKVTVKTERRALMGPDGKPTGEYEMVEVERIEVREERPAQWTASAWMLERRMPWKYGRRLDIQMPPSPDDEASPAARAAALVSEIEAYMTGRADAAQVEDEGPPPGVIDVPEVAPDPT